MLETLASSLDSIAAIAPTWGFVLVFAFMAVESSFIPFPSEVVMIPAGFFAARGAFGFAAIPALLVAIVVGVLGSILGAYVNYFLALKLGKPFLTRYGKWFFIKPEALDRSCDLFNRYGAATTFVCRLVPVIRQLISIPAGIARMPFGSFTLFTALGAGIWSAILALVGYSIGRSSTELTNLEVVMRGKELAARHLPYVILAAVLLVAAHLVLKHFVMGRHHASER